MGRWRGGGGGGIDHVSRSVSRRGTTCVFRAHALGGRADGARTDRVAYADRPLKTRTPRRGVTAAVTLKNDGGPRRAYYVPTLLNYARVMCRSLSGPLPPPPRNRTPRSARARTAANSSGRSARTPFTTRREIPSRPRTVPDSHVAPFGDPEKSATEWSRLLLVARRQNDRRPECRRRKNRKLRKNRALGAAIHFA